MSDPVRLREEGGEARSLLQAARRPRPIPTDVRARSATRVAALVAPAAIGAASWKILAKKIFGLAAFTAAGAGIGLAMWTYAHRDDRGRVEPTTTITSQKAPTTTTPQSPTPPAPTTSASTMTTNEPAASTPTPTTTATPTTSVKPTTSASVDVLAEETKLLDVARAEVDSDPAGALTVLDEHRAKFPSGKLSAEREYLAIEALVHLGRKDEAKARADSFSKRWPESPLAGVVSKLVE